jgi:hypothetical protein
VQRLLKLSNNKIDHGIYPVRTASLEPIIEWIQSNPRKPSNIAFTDSPYRKLAYLIEERERSVRAESLAKMEYWKNEAQKTSSNLEEEIIRLKELCNNYRLAAEHGKKGIPIAFENGKKVELAPIQEDD